MRKDEERWQRFQRITSVQSKLVDSVGHTTNGNLLPMSCLLFRVGRNSGGFSFTILVSRAATIVSKVGQLIVQSPALYNVTFCPRLCLFKYVIAPGSAAKVNLLS